MVLATFPLRGRISEDDRIAHALDRLTFGARPGELETVRKTGLKKWIELQLHPDRIAENPVLAERLKPLETLEMSAAQMVAAYPPGRAVKNLTKLNDVLSGNELRALRDSTPEERREFVRSLPPDKRMALMNVLPRGTLRGLAPGAAAEERRSALKATRPQAVIANDLAEGKLLRAIYSERQLAEVLADFWFNHFNIFLDKGADRYLVTSYERDAIRPHILGRFKDLVLATAEHPAMLFYLDNWQSVRGDAAAGRGAKRKRGLNENYARELLELHTLGVDGGYTQKDVTEVARCFTGWTIHAPRQGGGFEFNERLHDDGEKFVLGERIPAGGGKQDGLAVIDLLARHPSTARFVSRKLAVRFVSDDPPAPLVDRMAKVYLKNGGDLRMVMKTMLESKEFWAEGAYRAKVKTPLEMVVSATRGMDAEVSSAAALAQQVAQLGQPLYRKQEPTGYSNSSEEWVNSAGLLGRLNFAVALAGNKLAGVKVDASRIPSVRVMSPETRMSLENAQPGQAAGLLLGSPDFQRR